MNGETCERLYNAYYMRVFSYVMTLAGDRHTAEEITQEAFFRAFSKTAAFRDLKIGSTSGTVTVKLPAEPGFTCRAGTTSGSFSSDIALTKNGSEYTCGDGSAKCTIDTTSGDIRIGKVEEN